MYITDKILIRLCLLIILFCVLLHLTNSYCLRDDDLQSLYIHMKFRYATLEWSPSSDEALTSTLSLTHTTLPLIQMGVEVFYLLEDQGWFKWKIWPPERSSSETSWTFSFCVSVGPLRLSWVPTDPLVQFRPTLWKLNLTLPTIKTGSRPPRTCRYHLF